MITERMRRVINFILLLLLLLLQEYRKEPLDSSFDESEKCTKEDSSLITEITVDSRKHIAYDKEIESSGSAFPIYGAAEG